jgi:hypothetical protein
MAQPRPGALRGWCACRCDRAAGSLVRRGNAGGPKGGQVGQVWSDFSEIGNILAECSTTVFQGRRREGFRQHGGLGRPPYGSLAIPLKCYRNRSHCGNTLFCMALRRLRESGPSWPTFVCGRPRRRGRQDADLRRNRPTLKLAKWANQCRPVSPKPESLR